MSCCFYFANWLCGFGLTFAMRFVLFWLLWFYPPRKAFHNAFSLNYDCPIGLVVFAVNTLRVCVCSLRQADETTFNARQALPRLANRLDLIHIHSHSFTLIYTHSHSFALNAHFTTPHTHRADQSRNHPGDQHLKHRHHEDRGGHPAPRQGHRDALHAAWVAFASCTHHKAQSKATSSGRGKIRSKPYHCDLFQFSPCVRMAPPLALSNVCGCAGVFCTCLLTFVLCFHASWESSGGDVVRFRCAS